MPDRFYWDACVFLSYINGVSDRLPVLDDFLSRARKAEFEIVTSTWSITEVAFAETERDNSALDPAIEAQIDRLWADRRAIKLIEVHEIIQRKARGLMREAIARGWSLKPGDATHLASAINTGAKRFLTYDGDLKKFAELIDMPVEEPMLDQAVLGFTTPTPAIIAPEKEGDSDA